MSFPTPLKLSANHAQRRMSRERIAASFRSSDFASLLWSNVWTEPTSGAVMLRPPMLDAAWWTSNAGVNLKPTIAALDKSAGWYQNDVLGNGIVLAGTTYTADAWVRTPSTVGKNRPCWVFFQNSNPGDDYIACEAGWSGNSPPDGADDVSIRVWSSGRVEVWKAGEQVGEGSLGAFRAVPSLILLVPWKRRELLIVRIDAFAPGADRVQVNGFSHVFDDIDEDEAAPTITGDLNFWGMAKLGGTTMLVGSCLFPASGYVTSLAYDLSRPPQTGAALEAQTNPVPAAAVTNARVSADGAFELAAGATATEISAVTVVDTAGAAFTPDGTARAVRCKATLLGANYYTPFLYGVQLAYEADFADTDATEEVVLTDLLTGPPRLEIPDDPFGVRFTGDLSNPDAIETASPSLTTVDNAPVKVELGTVMIHDGVSEPPRYFDGWQDDVRRLGLESRDRMAALERSVFRTREYLDGMDLCKPSTSASAIKFVCEGVFDASEMVLEDMAYQLPNVPSEGGGWSIEPGDSRADVLRRLHQTLTPTFIYGVRPYASGMMFQFEDPATLGAAPVLTLYRTAEDAFTATGDQTLTYGDYTEAPLEVECNELWAMGWDPRLKRPIQVYSADAASQDPTTVPSLRPDNWVGDVRVTGVVEPRLQTVDALTRCVDELFPLLSERRWGCEFSCRWPWYQVGLDWLPLWRGDVVALGGRRTVRIASGSVEFVVDDGYGQWMESRWTGGTVLGMGGLTLDDIVGLSRVRAVNKTIRYPGSEKLRSGLVASVTESP